MKKIFAIVMAVVMVMALSISVFAEDVVWAMQATDKLGQHMGDDLSMTLGEGAALTAGGDGTTPRIATNWVNGDVFNAIVDAVKTDGATMKVVTSAPFTTIGFQSEQGGYESITVEGTEVDGKVLTVIDCAALVAAAPTATSGSFGGWCNFYVDGIEEGTILYSLEVVTGYEAAAAEPEAIVEPEAPAEPETPAEPAPAPAEPAPAPAEPTAPNTGLALAVIPAVMALAAVAVSKKH